MSDDIFPSVQHRQVLLATLKTLGVTRVEVDFSGGGDSGSIDGIHLTANGAEVDSSIHIVWPKESSQFSEDAGGWVRMVQEHSMPVKDVIETLTYKCLDYAGLDWYNNEGGSGSFYIDLTKSPPEIQLDVSINITSTEDHSFNFSGTGDE